MQADDFGTVLLCCRFRPAYAVNILIAGAVFLLLALDGIFFHLVLPRHDNAAMSGALGVVLTIGIAATVHGISELVRPRVLAEATDLGLVLHRQPGAPESASSAPPRFLVPWPRIRGLRYQVFTLPTGIRRARVKTIAVRLDAEDGFRVPEGFSHLLKPLPGSDAASVYLDAGTGSPGGRELLEKLEELRARHSAMV